MRITRNILKKKIQFINEYMGNEVNAYNTDGTANIGTLVLVSNIGGYQVNRIVNEGGGEHEITGRGTAREVFDQLNTFALGLRIANGEV
jgi:hypothetical protein